MGATQMYSFNVKSLFGTYQVQFINETLTTLNSELIPGDVIIVDNTIYSLYHKQLFENIKANKIIVVEANEQTKSYQGIIPVIQNLIENGFKKNHRIIAVGGGITQDVSAFISSVLYRGVDWIFFPTSLLAQGDSCIGSKTSINFGKFKNQIGGFYPPRKIFINLDFLNTLSFPEIKSGMGEMCHYFVVSGENDFKFFQQNYDSAIKDKTILAAIVSRSLEIKKSYVEIDEFDRKERLVFNYGHSFGHAIESVTNYRVPHGIAVSYGMDMANFVSVKLGFINDEVRQNIRTVLMKVWEGTTLHEVTVENLKNALSKDKKNVGNELRLILNKGIGNIFVHKMKMDEQFTQWLEEYFTTQLKTN